MQFQLNFKNMENFKIDLFVGEYNINFPEYSPLSEDDCIKIIKKLSEKFGLDFLSNEKIAYDLMQRQIILEKVDAKDNFHLMLALKNLDIIFSSNIYINWYQFRDIDLIKINDLDKYFYDIWFPSADDIDIFDENLNWIVSIRHDGVVSYIVRE